MSPILEGKKKNSKFNSLESNNLVFVSYCHADSQWLERLNIHLRPLDREGVISNWSDKNICPGEIWSGSIESALNDAVAAVMLVSADYFASDFVTNFELPVILDRAVRKELIPFWLAVSPSRYADSSIAQFQCLCNPDKPLTSLDYHEQERVLLNVSESIYSTLC